MTRRLSHGAKNTGLRFGDGFAAIFSDLAAKCGLSRDEALVLGLEMLAARGCLDIVRREEGPPVTFTVRLRWPSGGKLSA